MTSGNDIPHGDDELLDGLRAAWGEALDAPLPLDADDEPADARTAAAVHWARAAWNAQSAPTTVPDIDDLVARRRGATPAAAGVRAPAPWVRRAVAAAAVVTLLFSASFWMDDRTHPEATTDNAPLAQVDTQPVDAATNLEALDITAPLDTEPDVVVTRADSESIELVSGAVRLILVTSSPMLDSSDR